MHRISAELLSVLRCPVTGSTLTQEGDDLLSTVSGPDGEPLRYRTEDGIPVLLPTSR